MRYLVNNLKETESLAKEFAASLKVGDVVLLNGDLGAGKTTFTQFAFKELGVTDVVNSPTFAVVKSYQAKLCTVHHFDCYRVNVEEAIECGFDEILSDRNTIIFIEWSEMIAPLIPKDCILVNIKQVDQDKREIFIERSGNE